MNNTKVMSDLVQNGLAYESHGLQQQLENALSARERLIISQRPNTTWQCYSRPWRDAVLKGDSSLYTKHCLAVIGQFYASLEKQMVSFANLLGKQLQVPSLEGRVTRSFNGGQQATELSLLSSSLKSEDALLVMYFGGGESNVELSECELRPHFATPPRGSALFFFGQQAPAVLGVSKTLVPRVSGVSPFKGTFLTVRIADEELVKEAADNVVLYRRRKKR